MGSQERENKLRTSSVLNIIAGALFLVAGFNLLTGGHRIEWMYLLVGAVFIGGGIWGLSRA